MWFLLGIRWALLVVHPDSVGRATVKQGESVSYAGLQPLHVNCVTADFVYVRLHGDNDEHTYRYSDDELSRYVSVS